MILRTAAVCVGLLLAAMGVHAEEIEVRGGRTYRGFVRAQGAELLLNEYGCSAPEMTLGVRRFRTVDVRARRPWPVPDHLQRVLLELGPRDVERRVELLRIAQSARERDWTARIAAEILRVDPQHAEALRAFGGAERFAGARRGRLPLDPALARDVRAYLRIESGADRRDAAARLRSEHGYPAEAPVLERMVRSARPRRGLQESVALRLDADDHEGARYALYVPQGYDPLEPTPLLVALHGGGMLQAEKGEVRGSPKDALALYLDEATRLGWFLVAPQALGAPWDASDNLAMLDAVLEEVETLWNIDLERVHLAGQGGGAAGAWAWARRRGDRFASVSIAGGPKPTGAKTVAGRTALWIYHGEDDEVVPIEPIRKLVAGLARTEDDLVYCELPKEGHGLAPAARRDMFRAILPKRRRRAESAWPRSSFTEPVSRAAIAAFGDPAAAWGGGLDEDLDVAGLVAVLRAGRTEAEHAARRLMDRHADQRDVVSADVRGILHDAEAPLAARVWAAWLLGRWRDPQAVDELGDVLRSATQGRLLRYAAEAVERIGSADSVQDLRWALSDLSQRFRALPGTRVPFQDYERTARLGAAIAAALAACAEGEELLFAELEENLVRFVLLDRRPIDAVAANGEDPSAVRAALASALARAYRKLGAPKTLFDMLLVAVRSDKRATQAVRAAMRAPR